LQSQNGELARFELEHEVGRELAPVAIYLLVRRFTVIPSISAGAISRMTFCRRSIVIRDSIGTTGAFRCFAKVCVIASGFAERSRIR